MAKMTNAQLAAENAQLRAALEELRVLNNALTAENAALHGKLAAQRSAPAAWQDGAAQRKAAWDAALAAGRKPLKFVGGQLVCAA